LAAIEILSVSPATEMPDKLRGFSLESPTAGSSTDAFALPIRGWVLGRVSKAVEVEILHGGSVIRKTPVKEASTDVTQSYPEVAEAKNCRFHLLAGVLGLPSEFELTVRAVLENKRRVLLGTVRARHDPVRSSFEPRLRPITLTSLNRVGSTWVMGILAAHPQIVVHQQYPYEHSTAQYWVHMVKVLSEPANRLQSSKPGDFHNDLWHVGHNPFYDATLIKHQALRNWIGRDYVERLTAFCLSSIDDWYLEVARSQGQDEPVCFAEKGVAGHIPALTWELYPNAKEIFLVRDFRDMVCSLMAFYKDGTTRRRASNDEQYIHWLGTWASHLHADYESRADRAHLVRYEDVVNQPVETLAALFRYLELDASPALVDEIIKKASEQTPHFLKHRTTPNVQASIGRWRHDLDPALQRTCEETFGDLLGAFGYSS
jgi:hypothetical protein